jgi:hypothetical protein
LAWLALNPSDTEQERARATVLKAGYLQAVGDPEFRS